MTQYFFSLGYCLLIGFWVYTGGAYSTQEGKQYELSEDMDKDVDNRNIIEKKNGGKKVKDTPIILSEAQSVIVNEGDTVKLPCMVDRLEGFVMLWKKKEEIITVASQIIDKRVSLEEVADGNYLVLESAAAEDAGEYTCQISAYRLTQITHIVNIRVAPLITTSPESVLVVNAGSQAVVECRILAGSPTPQVRWIRKDHKKMDGKDEVVGSRLMIEQVSRHHAGYYLCLADNGFSASPVQREVKIEVLYAPEIDVDEGVVHTALGEEEELVCKVHAMPEANVTWMKEGKRIDKTSSNVLINSKHGRHSLTLLNTDYTTVGLYTCTASNSEGEQTKNISVTGHAKEVIILSPSKSGSKTSYRLEWTADSRTPISLFEVAVKKAGQGEWKKHNVIVDIPDVSDDENVIEEHSLELTGLEPSTLYQVTVASRNNFGLSRHSQIFTFSTKAAEPVHQPMVTKVSSSSSTSAKVSLLSFCVFLISTQ